MEVAVARVFDLPADAFSPLVAESERDGWRFVRRLVDEWVAGTNRFDRPGEVLLAACVDKALVGVCGLNADPYAGDPASWYSLMIRSSFAFSPVIGSSKRWLSFTRRFVFLSKYKL
jgi:hypothetical protein